MPVKMRCKERREGAPGTPQHAPSTHHWRRRGRGGRRACAGERGVNGRGWQAGDTHAQSPRALLGARKWGRVWVCRVLALARPPLLSPTSARTVAPPLQVSTTAIYPRACQAKDRSYSAHASCFGNRVPPRRPLVRGRSLFPSPAPALVAVVAPPPARFFCLRQSPPHALTLPSHFSHTRRAPVLSSAERTPHPKGHVRKHTRHSHVGVPERDRAGGVVRTLRHHPAAGPPGRTGLAPPPCW